MGDINCVVNFDERLGSQVRLHEISPPRECFDECEVQDINYTGCFYTWTNKQNAAARVLSKIDRVMANHAWTDCFPAGKAHFLPEGISDHCPMVITADDKDDQGKKPFKYFSMWANAPDYKERIKRAWSKEVTGNSMFQVVQKLREVKKELKDLNNNSFNGIQAKTEEAYSALVNAQTALHQDPGNAELARIEKEAAKDYNKKNKCFNQFLRQKAKIKWIQEGDANTRLFHRSLKAQRLKSNIHAFQDLNGNICNSLVQIANAFSQFYKQLIGSSEMFDRIHVEQHIVDEGPTLRTDQKEEIMRAFNAQDVKEAIFSIDGDKAPGPDGFGASFFKENWNIVGPLISDAVLDFFKNGRILKEINNTLISLIPKVQCPKDVSEFRPISCCNVIYKCITKLICSRLKLVLPDLIAENQGAFVHGRYIIHNIMVCQDMVRGYGRKSSAPGCIIKLDIKKAYDTVKWEFLEEMLLALGFPDTLLDG
ncbi:hypothetical protein RDABS01_015206 [Bienertia sinuspersici]